MVNSYGYWADIINAVRKNKPFPLLRINEIGSRMSSKTWSSIDGVIFSSLANVCKVDAFRHFKGKDRQELFDQFGKHIGDHVTVAATHLGKIHKVGTFGEYATIHQVVYGGCGVALGTSNEGAREALEETSHKGRMTHGATRHRHRFPRLDRRGDTCEEEQRYGHKDTDTDAEGQHH